MTRDNVPGAMYRDSASPIAEASRQFMAVAEQLPTLYSLADEFNALVSLLEEPEPDEMAIDAELEHVAADIRAKAYGIAIVIQGIENKAAMLKTEEQRLYAKRKVAEHAVERLKAYTLAQMQVMGQDRIDTGTFTLTVRQNPPSCVVVDAALVPSEYQKTKIEVSVDRRGILDNYRVTGEIPPGVSVERGVSLRIA